MRVRLARALVFASIQAETPRLLALNLTASPWDWVIELGLSPCLETSEQVGLTKSSKPTSRVQAS